MTACLTVEAVDGAARSGHVETSRGRFNVPCFMPVGTRGSVRSLSTADLEELGSETLLANTYHLMLRPGPDVVTRIGGIHRFVSWRGHVLTDSGGYQVMSLSPRLDDGGVTFRSVYDGSVRRLTPEGAVAIQERLGSDIQMALDVCPRLPAEPAELRLAVERTADWAARARRVHRREGQALFGIAQGGLDPRLRRESARHMVQLGFDGYAVGGLSVGESREQMLDALGHALDELPTDSVRYLMGVGDAIGLVEAIAMGVDLFDSVMPTRLARHGTVLTGSGRLRVRNAAYTDDDRPLDLACSCPVCTRWSRAYLHHLLSVGELSAQRLLSIHNLAWTLGLVSRAREAVIGGRGALLGLRKELAATWGEASP